MKTRLAENDPFPASGDFFPSVLTPLISLLLSGLFSLVVLSACASSPLTPTAPTSLWGAIITLGQTEQTAAPALWTNGASQWAAWVGADQVGVHQVMSLIGAGSPGQSVVLPLPPIHPYAQQVFPAADGNLHLLWLDAAPEGETRVFGALVNPALGLERGPTLFSRQSARRFIAFPAEDGGLTLISSGGLTSEPALFLRAIDSAGRPDFDEPVPLVSDADWPASTSRADRQVDIYWIEETSGRVLRAALVDQALQIPAFITTTIALNPGDRLDQFQAALDNTHTYLFWNLTRADGQHETWFAAGQIDSSDWRPPVRLGLDTTLNTPFETGFNSGPARAAQSGSQPLTWVKIMDGQFDVLPVAALLDENHLALVYFQNGNLVGYQDIAAVPSLLAPPSLLSDRDRHLYLAWSEPTPNGYADLNFTLTRRS